MKTEMKRIRKKDDPERVRSWNSRKAIKTDLKEALTLRQKAGIHRIASNSNRGRRHIHVLAQEVATRPIFKTLNTQSWTPAIRPILEAQIQEYRLKITEL